MKDQQTFFDFAAEVGLTKHLGGHKATEALLELCHLDKGQSVLDVGCGAGVTAVYIAKRYGCRVVGIDIKERMVERSKERAIKERVTGRVEFRVADLQELPFDDHIFDAVISESVTVFPADKQKAVHEYARVTKPGGYVGLNEATWLKVPPPPELVAWASQDLGATVKPLSSGEWLELLAAAGLTQLDMKIDAVKVQDEVRGLIQRYGFGGMLGVWFRTLLLYVKSPTYREFVKQVRKVGAVPQNIDEYFGYGLYVGRKSISKPEILRPESTEEM